MSTTRFFQSRPRHRLWISLCVTTLGLAIGLLTIGVGQSMAAPDQQGALHRIFITDVRDTQFVVSWTTDTPSNGQVEWGTTTALGSITADGVLYPVRLTIFKCGQDRCSITIMAHTIRLRLALRWAFPARGGPYMGTCINQEERSR